MVFVPGQAFRLETRGLRIAGGGGGFVIIVWEGCVRSPRPFLDASKRKERPRQGQKHEEKTRRKKKTFRGGGPPRCLQT